MWDTYAIEFYQWDTHARERDMCDAYAKVLDLWDTHARELDMWDTYTKAFDLWDTIAHVLVCETHVHVYLTRGKRTHAFFIYRTQSHMYLSIRHNRTCTYLWNIIAHVLRPICGTQSHMYLICGIQSHMSFICGTQTHMYLICYVLLIYRTQSRFTWYVWRNRTCRPTWYVGHTFTCIWCPSTIARVLVDIRNEFLFLEHTIARALDLSDTPIRAHELNII